MREADIVNLSVADSWYVGVDSGVKRNKCGVQCHLHGLLRPTAEVGVKLVINCIACFVLSVA